MVFFDDVDDDGGHRKSEREGVALGVRLGLNIFVCRIRVYGFDRHTFRSISWGRKVRGGMQVVAAACEMAANERRGCLNFNVKRGRLALIFVREIS